MKHHKHLERRTFTQDRFDILIKRQKSGKATFNELTELDDIVNRDPAIRESILEEMQFVKEPEGDLDQKDELDPESVKSQTWLNKVIALINRLFVILRTDSLNPGHILA